MSSQGGQPAASPRRRKSTWPFCLSAPRGDNAELKYQAEGVLESLSGRLFQLKNVHLASASAVESASKKDSVDKIARDLGVTLIVQGAVQGSGDGIRIALTLEDVAAKKRLWSQEFSGPRKDVLTLEDEIYKKLVAALDLKLGAEDLARGAT